jgi:hypothetical protein
MLWPVVALKRATSRSGWLAGAAVRIGLPPLEAMFNSAGTSYAAETGARIGETPIPSGFVLWRSSPAINS